jgi:hypothetical protein
VVGGGILRLGGGISWRTEKLDFAFDIDALLGLRRLQGFTITRLVFYFGCF